MAIESQEDLQKHLISSEKKIREGRIDELTANEKEARSIYQQQSKLPEEILELRQASAEHLGKGGVRVVRFGDTESSPDDLKKIISKQKAVIGGITDKDIFFHGGDLLEDFISFTDLQRGNSQAFRADRIAKDGGLEGKIADEFKNSYNELLNMHGVSDQQLLSGQVTEQLAKGVQAVYYGQMPHLATQSDKKEFIEHYEIFQKHVKTAIRNDARKKYEGYKKVFEEQGLTSDNLIVVPGNHDVLDVMYDVLGDYIPKAGEVFDKKGVKFVSPFHGSTGAHMGPEFGDTFGYVDISQQAEKVKQDTEAFNELHEHLKSHGVDYISKKDLSTLFERSQYRSSLGIGNGYLADYMEKRIKPQMDTAFEDARMKVATKVPKDVDFYLMHGQPNHPAHKGVEEYAVFKAIEKAGGGTILHGHQHGHTTHWEGNTLLLNEGEGKNNFGVYLHNPGKGIDSIFSQSLNRNTEDLEYKIMKPEQVGVQKLKGMD